MRTILDRRALVGLVLALLLVAGASLVWTAQRGSGAKHLTVTFASTTSLYQGAQVKVLGVRVGTVESITVRGTAVDVDIAYDPDIELPADVHAIVVPPSVVGDRFVQLAPAYTEGDVLADGASVALDHSGVPLELDDTYRALDGVASALGPKGANRDGALSRLVRAAARNLDGRGALFNSTIRELAAALDTLATGSGDISGTTRHLARFNRLLAGKDSTIRSLVGNLVLVSGALNGQRDRLAGAVTDLDDALALVADFTRRNRGALTRTVKGLTEISETLAKHTRELEEITDLAPVGLVNLINTYNAGNWDPSRPYATKVEGRTGSQVLHSASLNDLDVQVGYTLAAVCVGLPPSQRAQLAAFCDALESAGGDLGALVAGLPNGELPAATSRGRTSP